MLDPVFAPALLLANLVVSHPNSGLKPSTGESKQVSEKPGLSAHLDHHRTGSFLEHSDWRREARREIARGEYCYAKASDGVFSAPNRAHGLRSRLDAAGIKVTPRLAEDDTEWELELRTVRFGWPSDLQPLDEWVLEARESRIERRAAVCTEWYVNDERGIEQGWTVEMPPPGPADDELWIEIDAKGLSACVADDGDSALFVDTHGNPRLSYGGLRAWDMNAQELPASLVQTDCGLTVRVYVENAAYPITIDPVLEGPAWTAEGDQATAWFGHSLSGVGDVNGDGFADVVIGSYHFDNGEMDEGRAFLYFGSGGGPSLAPDWTAESDQPNAGFGYSVDGAGDVNGDGFADVVIGALGYDNGHVNEGRAFVYLGSPTGLSSSPDWTAEIDLPGGSLGSHVAGAGDVNGDGFDDVIVAAEGYSNGEATEGALFLYFGSLNGPSLVHDWMIEGNGLDYGQAMTVDGAGDVNGDDFDDVIVGTPLYWQGSSYKGRALLYLGSVSGPSLFPDWIKVSSQNAAAFGCSVSGAGDVNGDGFDDVIVGAKWFDNPDTDEGMAFLYLGSAGGLSTSAGWTAECNQALAWFASSVCGAGDVNGDGFDDVAVGAPPFDDGQDREGRTFLYLGSPSGPSLTADWTEESDQDGAQFGASVAGAGDVNADGFDDLLVSAIFFDNGESGEGRAFLFLGDDGSVGIVYCTANGNSTGAPAEITATGNTSSSSGDLDFKASPVPNQFGIFFHGANQTQFAFGCSYQCAAGGIQRGSIVTGAGNVAIYSYDNSDARHSLAGFVGTTRNFQYWYRDPAGAPMCGGQTFNTSNAVSIDILP